MTAHPAIAAVPKTEPPSPTTQPLLQALLVSRVAYIIGDEEDPTAFDPRGEDGSPVTLVLGYRGSWFWLDDGDSTTGHDGTTCIVTAATGGRYKVTGIDLLITSVISKTVGEAPDPDDVDEEARPSNGDSYIIPAAATGAEWPTHEGYIATWVEARREWFYTAPKAGWEVSIPGYTRDIRYVYDSVQEDWITGDGAPADDDSVPLSAIIGVGASLTQRVVNQTEYAPPGGRVTGGTPTMPLGGSASNINDDDETTTATTSALGNLTGAALASRIVARISFAAAKDLISINVRGVLGTAVSSSNAMGVYYSTNSGASYTQAGSGFTLSMTAQDIQRNGTFTGVTDIALVTEAKNWASNTHTLAELVGFTADVTASVGDAYIPASPAIGVFSGNENKVLRCESANEFTVYTPQAGDQVYDIDLGINIVWNGTSWQSSAGAWIGVGGNPFAQAQLTYNANSGSNYSYSTTTAPTTSSNAYAETTATYRARRAGNKLRIFYAAQVSVSAGGVVAALFRDSETNALQWFLLPNPGTSSSTPTLVSALFTIDALDDSSHDYKIWLCKSADSNMSVEHRTLEIMERAP